MNIIIALIVTLLGVVGLISWWGDFLVVLKGSIPVFLVFGGALALIAAASEMKEKLAPKAEEKK